jgi:integrase
MTKKDKHSSGPKTGRGKAASSRNSLTHGLTARRWLDANEQSLFDQTVAEFSADFEPQSSIERVLISKLAGLNQIGELSGHSFRVGAAIDLLNKNIPLEKIMLRGGWKSEASAMRYLQSWNDSNWLIIN